ncbi:PREDICTED: uncharacterized protein LOC104612293 [Nelumbo nucifera]|uniref:Uncharacterized protein LOC104612293 n=1 Tax=Nelumbo nucifera TaxID=4432 RepID=A0A1U8B9R6_NELNU|nr:PREDICTED: uncharacterized protein LOC104612293 [Nelumbo nucifera]
MVHRLAFSCFGRGSKSLSKSNPTAENGIEEQQATEEPKKGGAIMVELFLSQGCATSPEAELLISRLGRGDFDPEVPVIVLAFHVDYWDYMGWKDPFASSQWTVRQKAYVEALKLDTMFTPQVVIQGRTQCVATDQAALLSNITSAVRYPSLAFQAKFERTSPDSLAVSLTGALKTKVDSQGANVMVALYENELVTDCSEGENRGRILTNDYVVRRLENLCSVKDISSKKTVTGSVNFLLWEGFNSHKCGVVVFVQNNSSFIFGSQNFQLPDNL